MSDALLRAAFESRIKAWAAAQTPPLPIAYQNVPFDPPPGRYAACYLLPSATQSDTLNGEHRRRIGVFQVSLCMPIGAGSGEATQLAASLDAMIAPPYIEHGALRVFILAPMSQAPAIQSTDRYIVPISCTYRCDTV
jgi:hypothetical protein